MKRYLLSILIVLLIMQGCGKGSSRLKIDISGIADPGIKIQRYGHDLFSINPQNIGEELPELAVKYPFFLGMPPLDTLSYIQIHEFITDPFLIEIAIACDSQFRDLNAVEEAYNNAFRHYKYYYPDADLAEAYSYISGLDFEYPVQTHDGITLIALDMYLGPTFKPYAMAGIPQYRTSRARPEYIVRDIMLETGRGIARDYKTENILLDQMIEEGKLLYFLDATMPDVHDTIKIAYSKQQLEWCKGNESNLWAFIIENEMLFSSDYEKTHKLIIDGPFTSFFPDGSPARTGWWIGWQIVRSFMENNPDVSVPQLMETLTARQILDNSRYNP